MSDTTISIDLDPATVIAGLDKVSAESKKLAATIEEALGKNAAKSIKGLEDASENGTNKIISYFRNLGTRVKEDLKTAFDATGILAGVKMATAVGQGVKQVFEMEKAFDRLNVRLGLSVKQLTAFKNQLGRKVAASGQNVEDILPGVETAAGRGGIKSPSELAAIAESLAKSRAITGEATEPLSESIIEILKSSNQKLTGKSFQDTLDAVNATRKNGAFKTSAEAANAIEDISPYAKQLHMTTRESGGLVATASRSGASGQNILKQLLDHATTPGGMAQINAMLGQQVFKNGHLDQKALAKVDTHRFGQYSQQILGQQFSGANGGDLDRFIGSFKDGMDSFDAVVEGSNETSKQFDIATDNLATSIDKFKQQTKESGREIGEAVSQMANDIVHGRVDKLKDDATSVVGTASDNKGTLAAASALTIVMSIIAGGGLNSLLKKIPGSGAVADLVSGEAAKAEGVTPVFVTNAAQIGGGLSNLLTPGNFGGKAGINLSTAGGVSIAAAGGVTLGNLVNDLVEMATGDRGYFGTKLAESKNSKGMDAAEQKQLQKQADSYNQRHGSNMSAEEYSRDILHELKTMNSKQKIPTLTNPSAVTGRGGGA